MTVSAAVRWPSITRPPRAPLAATIARLLFERAVHKIPVRATYPGGASIGGGSPESPAFELVRPRAYFARLGRDSKIGFGEAYMAGDWRAAPGTDLADLLTPFAARLASLVPEPLQRLRTIVDQRIPTSHENTLDGSRDNVRAHYDLSNDLFGSFLDPTMSYSAAWFHESESVGAAMGLEEAQLRKIDGVLDWWRVEDIDDRHLLRLRAEMRLPGLAWLGLIIDADDQGRTLFRQRALFHPRGLAGHLYWAMVYPFHGFVFGGMQRNIARAAECLPPGGTTTWQPTGAR